MLKPTVPAKKASNSSRRLKVPPKAVTYGENALKVSGVEKSSGWRPVSPPMPERP
jgi:hypothetical protein